MHKLSPEKRRSIVCESSGEKNVNLNHETVLSYSIGRLEK